MAEHRLVDAVTLRHFGIVDRLDILQSRLNGYDFPRWTEAVWSEVFQNIEAQDCERVLQASFLGAPHELSMSHLANVFRIRRALALDERDSQLHLGEAESICVADHLNGTLITDDADAFLYAERNLGGNRVLDTVDLLREAVAAAELTTYEAKQVADGIRNSGRHLRAGHPPTLMPDYFMA